MTIIFDRELCSKVLKETFLLFLFFLLAWNQVKKNVREQNLLQSEQKMWQKEQKMLQGEQKNFEDENCLKSE